MADHRLSYDWEGLAPVLELYPRRRRSIWLPVAGVGVVMSLAICVWFLGRVVLGLVEARAAWLPWLMFVLGMACGLILTVAVCCIYAGREGAP